ncbi:MAG: bifunctional DNA-formamidopyrimidine glycosylase/DNA-(apurinic or apyrimidinic site) lyase [bacterium]|nr:bifunctional DNA-formamidopyrimidine glycosylase/DNA-(apurinic or apyrimidinic site) lyase [bacterium]
MPELPEVETVVRGLRQTVTGKTIASVTLNNPPSTLIEWSKSFGRNKFVGSISGRTIEAVNRRGKNILILLSGDLTLWAHLKMTGHFFLLDKKEPVGKHDLVVFELKGKNGRMSKENLRFNDYRRFGRLRLFPNEELWEQKGLATLGPEPFDISAKQFVDLCQSTKRMIKPALLDQTFIAGLGNIYADETLHLARIHPKSSTASVSVKKLTELHRHIQEMLRFSISKMGTSVDSFSGVNGKPGQFQKYLKAYGREGEPCSKCDRPIVREKIGSRSAHFCPRCQRPGRSVRQTIPG